MLGASVQQLQQQQQPVYIHAKTDPGSTHVVRTLRLFEAETFQTLPTYYA